MQVVIISRSHTIVNASYNYADQVDYTEKAVSVQDTALSSEAKNRLIPVSFPLSDHPLGVATPHGMTRSFRSRRQGVAG